MPPPRGHHQRRVLVPRENPEEVVVLKVRVPYRLRAKAHAAAAVLNVSATAYLEQLLEAAPMPEPVQTPLPRAESA